MHTLRLRRAIGTVLLGIASVALPPVLGAQGATLRAGPMNGYATHREAVVWVQTTGPAKVRIAYWDTLAPGTRWQSEDVATRADDAFAAKIWLGGLTPGRGYAYEVLVDGRKVNRPYPHRFQTQALWQWRTDPPPFRLVFGSCFYVNEPAVDRPGEPYGAGFQILQAMSAARPDVVLWGGDNTYLREVDWNSRLGVFSRYTHTRGLPELQPLLAQAHHLATWDDHDFGPNDADRSYVGRQWTLDAFSTFWANPTTGVPGMDGGIATMATWQDVDLFLLDDRWARAANNRRDADKPFFGEAQVLWLIDALAASSAPFKLVVSGGQVLNPAAVFENYSTYPAERERLLRAIEQQRIPGVVFLSGDRHHTELTRMPRRGTYPLYDLTVSPLTAGVSRGGENEGNAWRVEGTYVAERNFATLDVRGPRTARELVITVRNADGQERWTRTIKASELR